MPDIVLKEYLNLNDKLGLDTVKMPSFPKEIKNKASTLWKRTEILCSTGDVILNKNGKSTFAPGCPFSISTNMVPIGGVQYAMERLFGIKGEIEIPTLYDLTAGSKNNPAIPTKYDNPVGVANSPIPTETFNIPGGQKTIIYRPGNIVQLFGIGITGTAENDITVFPVNYRENSIDLTIASEDNQTVNGIMVPFRYTTTELRSDERKQYFGKMKNGNDVVSYYLKRFESDPVIKHVWKSGEDSEIDEEENIVSADDIWSNTSNLNAVESFTEFILKINTKDTKEWFAALNQEDRARVNTIALFTGEYVTEGALDSDGDYRDVRLFSKLNIPVEYLTLNKDLNIIYRVYGA